MDAEGTTSQEPRDGESLQTRSYIKLKEETTMLLLQLWYYINAQESSIASKSLGRLRQYQAPGVYFLYKFLCGPCLSIFEYAGGSGLGISLWIVSWHSFIALRLGTR